MSAPRDPDDIVMAWLDEGPTRLPDQTRRAIAVGLPTVTQRRRLSWVPWRFPTMSAPLRLAAAIAVIAIVGVAGLNFLRPAVGPGSGASPTPTPIPTPTPEPIDTSTWKAYTSGQYGFTMAHPADWTVFPAQRDWTYEADGTEFITAAADRFAGPSVEVSAWRVRFDEGTTAENVDIVAWVEDYCARTFNVDCDKVRNRSDEVPSGTTASYDLCAQLPDLRTCHRGPGLFVWFPTEVQAFFTGGNHPADRMTIVTVWRPQDHSSTASYGGSMFLLQNFLRTMDVFPPF